MGGRNRSNKRNRRQDSSVGEGVGRGREPGFSKTENVKRYNDTFYEKSRNTSSAAPSSTPSMGAKTNTTARERKAKERLKNKLGPVMSDKKKMVILTTIVKDAAKDDKEIAQILFGSTIKDFELKIQAFLIESREH